MHFSDKYFSIRSIFLLLFILALKKNIVAQCTPRVLPFNENFSGSPFGACAPTTGGWTFNTTTSGGNQTGSWWAPTTNYAGGTSPEAEAYGDQACGGCSQTLRLTSPPINTSSTTTMALTFKHNLYLENLSATGSNNFVITVQTSPNNSTWTTQYTSATYTCTTNGIGTAVHETRTVNLSGLGTTTYVRFNITGVLFKIWGWEIDDIGNLSTLPIELLSFTGQQTGSQVKLDWVTATETDNDFFTVERSSNGLDFVPVKTIPGAGNSKTTLYYSAIDERPESGINYYRLKQTDYSGWSKYSNLIEVNYLHGAISAGNIFPNPADDEVNFYFHSAEKADAEIRVTDVTGRIVISETQNVLKGDQTLAIPVSALSPGIYYLKVSVAAAGYSYTARIIKN